MQSKLKRANSTTSRPKRRGVILVFTALALLALIGLVGLAVDMGVAYFLQARLSQAADAAALAGARSLSRGADLSTQASNAQAVATRYFNANFPSGFWGCTTSLQTPLVTAYNPSDSTHTDNKVRYVTIRASATAPLYFMRALGLNTTTIGTSAQAARRDANIMIILDRSGSMSAAVSQLVTSANWFVNQFAPGRDKVGLVTFGGSYSLVKPTLTSIPSVTAAINTLTSSTVAGTTNHSQPLWVAYQALADPLITNEPGAWNAIVFFTDGQPNTILADFYAYRKNPSTCDKNGTTMIGYALGSPVTAFFGTSLAPPYQPTSTSAGTTPSAYVSTAYDSTDSCPASGTYSYCTASSLISQYSTNYSGCSFVANSANFTSDITQIPPTDYYGNQTNPASPYKTVTLTSVTGANITNAAFNAADQAAQRMRAGALGSPTPIVPVVDTIALNTGQTPDDVYMKRLANANDTANTIYDSTKPTGMYVYASTTADLQSAFIQIASQILHLSM